MPHPSTAMAAGEQVSFVDCFASAFRNDEMRRQFERLTGHSLAGVLPANGLDQLIDSATGHNPAQSPITQRYMQAFAAFVRECIWTRLPVEVRALNVVVPSFPLLSAAGEVLPS